MQNLTFAMFGVIVKISETKAPRGCEFHNLLLKGVAYLLHGYIPLKFHKIYGCQYLLIQTWIYCWAGSETRDVRRITGKIRYPNSSRWIVWSASITYNYQNPYVNCRAMLWIYQRFCLFKKSSQRRQMRPSLHRHYYFNIKQFYWVVRSVKEYGER